MKVLFESDILDNFCLLGLKKLLVLMAKALMCKTVDLPSCFIYIFFITPESWIIMPIKFPSH